MIVNVKETYSHQTQSAQESEGPADTHSIDHILQEGDCDGRQRTAYHVTGCLGSCWRSIVFVHQESVVDLGVIRLESYRCVEGELTLKSSCMHNPAMNCRQSGMAMCWIVLAQRSR